MPKYRQYLLRLNPGDPDDQALITRLDEAGSTWGGVQRFLKEAVRQMGSASRAVPPSPSSLPVPSSLVEALKAVMPGATSHAAQALAASEPLHRVRALYIALDSISPNNLTETEALLLQELQRRTEALLREAAEQRQPIRHILAKEK